MGTAEIARNLRVSQGYGYECCGNSAGMDIITAETPREWLENLAVKNFGVHMVFRQTMLFASFVVMINIAKVARGLLSMPTNSTSSERSFSLAGNTLADPRSRLSPELVDGLMLLHGLK